MKAFQKPLSISQEKYYLQKYQEGDSQAKNILIEHNLRLVAHVVKKYQGTGEDTDDLEIPFDHQAGLSHRHYHITGQKCPLCF